MDTRTAKVRVGLFETLECNSTRHVRSTVSLKVPMGSQLVIRQVASCNPALARLLFVSRSDGYIEPREVQAGHPRRDDFNHAEGVKVGRTNCCLRKLPKSTPRAASGCARFIRSSSARRERGFYD